jgi:GNAT superfamily N-acetyltransferase
MEIRKAVEADYAEFARLVPELDTGDPIPSHDRFVDDLLPGVLVMAQGRRVAAYAYYEILRGMGYVRQLVVDAQHRRRGIGTTLMQALRERFVSAQAHAWCLNVLTDNVAAIALYRAQGLHAIHRSHVLRLGAEIPRAPLPEALDLRPIRPEREGIVENALGLLPGQLANSRARGGRSLLELLDGPRTVGVAVFNPVFPGAFPFRVVAPHYGPALAQGLRPLCPPGSAYLQVVIENDDASCEALLQLGARRHRELLHMRGALARSG